MFNNTICKNQIKALVSDFGFPIFIRYKELCIRIKVLSCFQVSSSSTIGEA